MMVLSEYKHVVSLVFTADCPCWRDPVLDEAC